MVVITAACGQHPGAPQAGCAACVIAATVTAMGTPEPEVFSVVKEDARPAPESPRQQEADGA